MILPRANREGVGHDVPKEVRVRTQFVTAKTVREVLDAAFGPGSLLWLADAREPASGNRIVKTKRTDGMEIMDVTVCAFYVSLPQRQRFIYLSKPSIGCTV